MLKHDLCHLEKPFAARGKGWALRARRTSVESIYPHSYQLATVTLNGPREIGLEAVMLSICTLLGACAVLEACALGLETVVRFIVPLT